MGLGLLALEAVWMGRKGLVEGGLAIGMDSLCRTVVDAVRGHVAYARVLVLVVVPGEELLAESACIGQTTEAFREVWAGQVPIGLKLSSDRVMEVLARRRALRLLLDFDLGELDDFRGPGRVQADVFGESCGVGRLWL